MRRKGVCVASQILVSESNRLESISTELEAHSSKHTA